MKRFLILTLLLITFVAFANAPDSEPIKDCQCKGKNLYGNVFVTSAQSAADFIVCINNAGSDLEVEVVDESAANSCGLWHFTSNESNADFIIYITDNQSAADFSISFKD